MIRDVRIWVVTLGAIAVGLIALIARDVVARAQPAPPPRLATVGQGTVRTVVSGTGTVVPASQVNLNFRVAGQLTEIMVKVGDQVAPGQTLARLDSRSQQTALAQARASLQSAQASLQAALTPLTPEQVAQLQHALAAAQQAYNDAVNAVNITNQQDAATLAADQQQLAQDQAQFTADSCPTSAPSQSAAAKKCSDDQHAIDQDLAKITADQNRQQQNLASGQSRTNSAQAAVVASTDQLTVQSQQKPNAIAAARAQVASTEAQVAAAQLTLDSTVLAAPSRAVVLALNGQVGESVSAGAAATPQAPGSTAPQPVTSQTSGAGSAFIVLANVSNLEVVVPFAEPDAARLKPDLEVSLTFDAVPDLNLRGHLVATAASATVISNVVNYYATMAIDNADPRLRTGMTANAAVTVTRVDNVLTVPNAALRRQGDTAMVMVYANGRTIATPLEVGLTGDTLTEVRSGLKPGDRIVLPSPRLTTGAGGGGGGGIRVGGGLFGGGGGGGK